MQGHKAAKDHMNNFYLLLDLMTFFSYYHKQTFNDALSVSTNSFVNEHCLNKANFIDDRKATSCPLPKFRHRLESWRIQPAP